MSSSLENVPQLPPLDCAQSYSENPYEIDLSFRQLDILAFKQQQRRSKSEFRNNMSLCTSGVSATLYESWKYGYYLKVDKLIWLVTRKYQCVWIVHHLLSCLNCPSSTVMSELSIIYCHVWIVHHLLSCLNCPSSTVMSKLSIIYCHVWIVHHVLSHLNCPSFTVMSELSIIYSHV